MVTIYDIAKRANVSAMTVSRVINNTGRISDETRARVKKVMEEMHYVPNQMARSLVLQATRMLYLLIPTLRIPFSPPWQGGRRTRPTRPDIACCSATVMKMLTRNRSIWTPSCKRGRMAL